VVESGFKEYAKKGGEQLDIINKVRQKEIVSYIRAKEIQILLVFQRGWSRGRIRNPGVLSLGQ
jgi:hypothetical protein